MPGEEVGSEGGVVVAAYAEPPPRLLALLRLHAPHSLPLLRRLEFTRFPGGITEHARILWASEAALQASSPESGSELESDSDIAFAAGYLDLSRSKKIHSFDFVSILFQWALTKSMPHLSQTPPCFVICTESDFRRVKDRGRKVRR